ncbi:hypothetical protein F4809DRAFT_613275 [Biscogniauxia mediterranea]|nr:hypothetical protein F4809DRAFT_613275 [Biscogniauxia mediterranea]
MSRAFLTGASFGAALAASGIYQPDVIIAQLELENWHMIQTFLTASGTSMLIVTISRHLGYLSNAKPRSYASLGVLPTSLDGNIIGGCLQGVGMALAGACSGTVFAQVGGGVRSGLYTLGGTLIGGVLWSGFIRDTIQRHKQTQAERKKGVAQSNSNDNSKVRRESNIPLSVHELLGAKSSLPALVIIESVFAAVVATVSLLGLSKTTDGSLVNPIIGGLLVSGAQLASIIIRGSLLGTSTSFEEFGDYVVWWIFGARKDEKHSKPTSGNAMILVTGMMIGALGVSFAFPPQAASTATTSSSSGMKSLIGGVLLAVGSRIAGGCTSGHGISGISLFSVSSFVTVAAMFVGGMGIATLLK